MSEPKATATFVFDDEDRKGTVTVNPGTYGLDIEVTDGETKWSFAVDLFYLAPGGTDEQGKSGCVQIIAYHPQHPDADPVKHLRVWPGGRVETFES